VLSLFSEGPSYEVAELTRPGEPGGLAMPGPGRVPFLDMAATFDAEGKTATLFVLNRDLVKPRELLLEWQGVTPSKITKLEVLTGPDLKATNTFEAPKQVVPQPVEPPRAGTQMTLRLPAHSYTRLTVSV
jgi:alpha-N-arabinofuranosidase